MPTMLYDNELDSLSILSIFYYILFFLELKLSCCVIQIFDKASLKMYLLPPKRRCVGYSAWPVKEETSYNSSANQNN